MRRYYYGTLPSGTDAKRFLALFSNEKRLQIISHLAVGETSVGNLADFVGLSQSAISQHLAKLRAAGVVTTRRDKQTIYYSANSAAAVEFVNFMDAHFGAQEAA